MRLLVQRVRHACVVVDGRTVGAIEAGLLVLAGTTHGDADADARALADKLVGLRIFSDADGKMNRSVVDVGGSVLLVSQFTLYGSVRKGKRPSFTAAGDPAEAERLVAACGEYIAAAGLPVAHGEFGAAMEVSLLNDGPVTLMLESEGGRVL